jgi:hypothetical protein
MTAHHTSHYTSHYALHFTRHTFFCYCGTRQVSQLVEMRKEVAPLVAANAARAATTSAYGLGGQVRAGVCCAMCDVRCVMCDVCCVMCDVRCVMCDVVWCEVC